MNKEKISKEQKRWEYGKRILKKIFKMPRSKIVEALKPLCENRCGEFNWNLAVCQKSAISSGDKDIPNEIILGFYSLIRITANGITFKPEHGKEIVIAEFTENFKI